MKRILSIVLTAALIFTLSGCGGSGDGNNTADINGSGVNLINIYYAEGNEVMKSDTWYQLKQPDSVTASVEEVMTALIKEFDGKIPSYTYMLDDKNNVSLDLTLDGSYTKEDYLLMMAAVSNTIFQIDGVESIDINMVDGEGEIVAGDLVMRDSFYFYGYPADDKYNAMDITIFTANSDGTGLVSQQMVIYAEPNVSAAEKIVASLAEAETIPVGTEVNSVSVNAGVCYLDLNSNFEDNMSDIKSDVVVYSVVNSITSLPNIDKVQLLIDGENIDSYRKVVNIKGPLVFNNDILEE